MTRAVSHPAPKLADVVPIIRALWKPLGSGYVLRIKAPDCILAQLQPNPQKGHWVWKVQNSRASLGDQEVRLSEAQDSAELYVMALLRESGKTRRWEPW
jgi:hypothetical protein